MKDNEKNAVVKNSAITRTRSKYDNDLNRTKEINGYSAFEQNIFFLIASKFTQSNETSITIPMNTIYDLSKDSYHNNHVVKMTKKLGKRIANLNFYKTVKMDDGKVGLRIGHLFTYIDITNDYVRCSLDPLFIDYFRNISNSFTAFDLDEFIDLKSKYSKTLYRCLLDLKNYGHPVSKGASVYSWHVSLSDYRDILRFPKSYQVGRITMKTISCIEELLKKVPRFKKIEVKSVYDSHKRGRPLEGFVFEYEFRSLSDIQRMNSAAVRAVSSATSKLCPFCGKPVEEKNGKYGTFIGHAFKGSCEKTWESWDSFEKECRRVEVKDAGTGATTIPADQMQYLELKMKKDFQNAKSDDKNSNLQDIKGMIAEVLNSKKEL